MRLMKSDIDGSEPINLGNPVELTVCHLAERIAALAGTLTALCIARCPRMILPSGALITPKARQILIGSLP